MKLVVLQNTRLKVTLNLFYNAIVIYACTHKGRNGNKRKNELTYFVNLN